MTRRLVGRKIGGFTIVFFSDGLCTTMYFFFMLHITLSSFLLLPLGICAGGTIASATHRVSFFFFTYSLRHIYSKTLPPLFCPHMSMMNFLPHPRSQPLYYSHIFLSLL